MKICQFQVLVFSFLEINTNLSISSEVIILKKYFLYQSVSEISILQKCHFSSSGSYACVPILMTPFGKMTLKFLNNNWKDLNIIIWKTKAIEKYVGKFMTIWAETIEKGFLLDIQYRHIYLLCKRDHLANFEQLLGLIADIWAKLHTFEYRLFENGHAHFAWRV